MSSRPAPTTSGSSVASGRCCAAADRHSVPLMMIVRTNRCERHDPNAFFSIPYHSTCFLLTSRLDAMHLAVQITIGPILFSLVFVAAAAGQPPQTTISPNELQSLD